MNDFFVKHIITDVPSTFSNGRGGKNSGCALAVIVTGGSRQISAYLDTGRVSRVVSNGSVKRHRQTFLSVYTARVSSSQRLWRLRFAVRGVQQVTLARWDGWRTAT